jgi:hypothetical protein
MDALIDLSQRGRHNVELALARLWLFALGFHTSPTIKRILGLLRRDPETQHRCDPGGRTLLSHVIKLSARPTLPGSWRGPIIARTRSTGTAHEPVDWRITSRLRTPGRGAVKFRPRRPWPRRARPHGKVLTRVFRGPLLTLSTSGRRRSSAGRGRSPRLGRGRRRSAAGRTAAEGPAGAWASVRRAVFDPPGSSTAYGGATGRYRRRRGATGGGVRSPFFPGKRQNAPLFSLHFNMEIEEKREKRTTKSRKSILG